MGNVTVEYIVLFINCLLSSVKFYWCNSKYSGHLSFSQPAVLRLRAPTILNRCSGRLKLGLATGWRGWWRKMPVSLRFFAGAPKHGRRRWREWGGCRQGIGRGFQSSLRCGAPFRPADGHRPRRLDGAHLASGAQTSCLPSQAVLKAKCALPGRERTSWS